MMSRVYRWDLQKRNILARICRLVSLFGTIWSHTGESVLGFHFKQRWSIQQLFFLTCYTTVQDSTFSLGCDGF